MDTITLGQINVNNIGYSRPRHTNKGYNVVVNYAGKCPIIVKTDIVTCPFGVDKNNNKMSMKLFLTNQADIDTLMEIDDQNSSIGYEQGWFEDSEEVFYYTPFMGFIDNKIKQKAALRVKIPIRFNKIETEVNSKSNPIATVGDIVAGSKLKCTLEWRNLWIVDNNQPGNESPTKTVGYFWNCKEVEIVE